MTQSFFIRARLPGLNKLLDLALESPHAFGRAKKRWGGVAAMFARRDGMKPVTAPVKIHFHFFEPNTKLDPDNLCGAAAKVILDALQEIGILPNDNQHWVRGLAFSWEVSEAPHGVKVTIEDA